MRSTVGHIKDLPSKEMGIDVEDGFKPKYQYIPGKQKVVKSLKQAAADTHDVYLAPDPDREGEAIAWHLFEVLKLEKEKIVVHFPFCRDDLFDRDRKVLSILQAGDTKVPSLKCFINITESGQKRICCLINKHGC